MAKAMLITGVYQDGAQFYLENPEGECDELLASYPEMVKNDYDMEGAIAARFRFVEECPEYGYKIIPE